LKGSNSGLILRYISLEELGKPMKTSFRIAGLRDEI
jgi:hypothetical protein